MIVVDANVVVMALSSATAQGDVAHAAMAADDDWIAPAHMPLEVMRTISKAVGGGHMNADDASAAFRTLTTMQIEYVGTDALLLQAIWAMRHNVSVYDAAYLAVAALRDAPLVTFDARLAKAAQQTTPNLRVNML
ncbi:type II toxin-antitoxin system VapC family toxin [Mycolicibacterium sp. XJ870]